MGRYLSIGIVTRISIDKELARKKADATTEEIRETLQKHYNKCDIYHLGENEQCVFLSLKPEIVEEDLAGLLQDFYEMRYPDEKTRVHYVDMDIVKESKTYDEWMELAADKQFQAFQFDEILYSSTPFPGGWTESLNTDIQQIILSLDGKIIMECYGEIFTFFTQLLKEKLSKYRLSDSLLVDITS